MEKKVIILTKEQIELNPLNNWENGDMRDLIESLKSVELITPVSYTHLNDLYKFTKHECSF